MNRQALRSSIPVGDAADRRGETAITARSETWGRLQERGGAGVQGKGTVDLPARLRSGDPAALAELAETWGPRLYRYLARYAPDPETARDLAQEALLRALKAMRAGARPDDLLAWLYRIATNLARDEHKSAYRRRVELYDALEPPAAPSTDDNPERIVLGARLAAARQEAVGRAVAQLAPELREVIVLRFSEDLPVKTIAAIQGIPEGTAKSRLYRAYRALEAQLAPWRPGNEEGETRG